MKKILILNPLKDIPYYGLTTHAVNVFSRISDDFIAYAYFTNPAFERGTLRRLPEYNFFKGLKEALKSMRKLRPDILYGTGALIELVFLLFRPRQTKYMIAWHGPYDKRWLIDINNNSFRARWSYYLIAFLLSRADIFACDSEFIARTLRKHFPKKKVVVTLNGVDAEFYSPQIKDKKWLSEKNFLKEDAPLFIFVGHLIRRKRPEIFIMLARKMPEAQFLIIGREGLYTATDVEQWKSEAKNLMWVPLLDREDMSKLFASASALIFPSLEEPFGLAVVEAMASGLPVVAAHSGALPELIEDGRQGFLIPVDNSEDGNYETAARIIMKGGEGLSVMEQNARERAKIRFNWENVAKKYEKAFLGI